MADTPVKITGIDSNGKPQLKEFSTTEENYLAYQAGLNLAGSATSVPYTLNVSTGTTVGSFSDTSFDQVVGTHGQTLTTSTTTTTLKQKTGTAAESGASRRKPVHYAEDGPKSQLHEMTSSEVSSLTDRLVSRIFTSDYPGTYKLATSLPTGGYTVKLSNVFSDTRTDGTTQNYSIYKRTSMTSPTVVRPLAIKRSSGLTGTYQGLQEMSDAQIQYTFGQRAQTRIMDDAQGVGSYLLLSSAQGNPTTAGYSGTWASKGVATDTRNTVDVNKAYTRLSTRSRSSAYTRISVGNFTRDFTGNYTRVTSTRTSTRTSSRDFAGNFLGNFTTDYSRNFVGANSTRTRPSSYTREAIVNSTRDSVGDGDYLGNYTGEYSRNFSRTRASNYSRNFAGNFSTDYSRNFAGNFLGNYTGNYTGATPTFTRIYTGNYTRQNFQLVGYSLASPANYWYFAGPTGNQSVVRNNITVATTSDMSATEITSGGTTYKRGTYQTGSYGYQYYNFEESTGSTAYTRTETGFVANYTRDSVGPLVPAGTYTAYAYDVTTPASSYRYWAEEVDFVGGNAVSVYWGSNTAKIGPNGSSNFTHSDGYQYDRGPFQTSVGKIFITQYYSVRRRYNIATYVGNYTRTRNSTYSRLAAWTRLRTSTNIVNRASSYSRVTSTRTSNRNYSRNIIDDYSRNYTRISTRTDVQDTSYIGDFTGNYLGNYSRNFIGDFIQVRSSNYSRVTSTRTSTRTSSRDYAGNFLGDFTTEYTRDRTSSYTRDFEGNYSRNFAGNYTGNYVSDEILSGNETIETYTLYVRTG